ncbi:MAG: DUF2600 family protein [Candidatus Baltobacteraceae bacterium]
MLDEEIRWAVRRVLLDPQRLRVLLSGGFDNVVALRVFFSVIVPEARAALARLQSLAERIPDDSLRAKALHTLQAKAYHVAGACVLAAFLPSGAREHYIGIVAPLESIYDFLDTLCDREPQLDARASRQLHLALSDALDPYGTEHAYFLYGPDGDDGDYLKALVRRVRHSLKRLFDHELLLPVFAGAARLYTETQTLKHLPAGHREEACAARFSQDAARSGLSWFEYAAGAGSQFHVYGALYAGFCSRFDRAGATYDAYFPELAAVHVLLDAFIDQAEDRAHAELNWLACYANGEAFAERMGELARRSSAKFACLPLPGAHRFALRLMSLFYLTHRKIRVQHLEPQADRLLRVLAAGTT